jgi:hypothetical protein
MSTLGWPAAMRIGAVLGVVGVLAPSLASAEIYAWIDANGDVTYGNMPPPKNARVFEVIDETPLPTPEKQAAIEAAHQAEMRALNQKVQQLEQQLQQSHYQAMPPPPYPMAAPSPYAPAPEYSAGPSYPTACDSDFYDCSSWAGPVYYTVGVLPYGGFRHHHDFDGFHRHGHFPHPGGGSNFVSMPHVASAPHVSAPHASAGSFHASSYGSGSMGHSR